MASVFTAVVDSPTTRAGGTDPKGVCPNNRFWNSPRSGAVPPTSRSSGHLGQVLVAPARQADQDRVFFELERFGKRVCRLEGRDDPFRLGEPAEGGHGLVVGRAHVLRPPGVA